MTSPIIETPHYTFKLKVEDNVQGGSEYEELRKKRLEARNSHSQDDVPNKNILTKTEQS